MTDPVHPVPQGFGARIGPDELAKLHELADSDPDRFWLDQARRLCAHRNVRRDAACVGGHALEDFARAEHAVDGAENVRAGAE